MNVKPLLLKHGERAFSDVLYPVDKNVSVAESEMRKTDSTVVSGF